MRARTAAFIALPLAVSLSLALSLGDASTAAAQEMCPPAPALTETLRPGGAMAQEEPLSILGLVEPGARFAYVHDVLDTDARHARTWTAAWWVLGLAFIAGNATFAALTTNSQYRVDAIVETAKSLLIPADLILQPVHVMRSAKEIDHLAEVYRAPDGHIVSCVPLARAEELLVDAAEDEALATRWLAQVVVIGGNLVVSAVMGFGFSHWTGAGLGLVGGIGVGEIEIFTHPTASLDALDPYARGHLGRRAAPLSAGPFVAPPLAIGGVTLPAPPAWGTSVRLFF